MKHFFSTIAIILSCIAIDSVSAQSGEQLSQTVRVDGCQIILADERDLAAGQNAIVSAVHVREGDRVRKGMLIAELDARVPKATLEGARKPRRRQWQ